MALPDGSIPAPFPHNEEERLRVLKSYCVLDSPPEPAFDHLTKLASSLFHAPIVLISLVDENRQFFKSTVGVTLRESPRDSSFCAYSILHDEPLVILDTHNDERFRTNPFVTGEPHIRFYASAPLRGRDGMMLGGFSIIDQKPRTEFSAEDRACLQQFAALAVLAMENRLYPEHIARIEKEILSSHERYTLATKATTEGIWDWDCATNKLFQSARLRSILGLEPADTVVSIEDWLQRLHPDDRHIAHNTIARLHTSGKPSFQSEYRVRHSDGGWRWVLNRGIAVRDAQNKLVRMVGAVTDITGPKFIDELTGLHTRTFLLDFLERRMRESKTSASMYALIFVDLDSFKRLNSSLGRASGDELLIQVGQRLSKSIEDYTGSIVARISGDEFVIVLDSIQDWQAAVNFADSLHGILAEPIRVREQNVIFTASIGIAFATEACAHATDFLQRAEVARQESKRLGGGKTLVYSDQMQQKILRQIAIASSLPNAIANNLLDLYYQPKLDLNTNTVVGFEALSRWNHPHLGFIPPPEFIQIAEECDLIFELGQWAIQRAITQLAQWRDKGLIGSHVTMAVNLSAKQLADRRLLDEMSTLLKNSNIDPACLSLEVTEGMLINDTDSAVEILQELKSLGLSLDLDDFGTGYSSLSYLQKFPFDALKIDRSFVSDIMENPDRAALVRSIIALGHTLNLSVVAEGIETTGHLTQLRNMGCNYGQGYLFSKPLPPKEMEVFLGGNNLQSLTA